MPVPHVMVRSAPVAAMLGFAMLLIGGFSRFGVWRQVIWAVVALIVVQFLGTAAEAQVAQDASRWPLIYLPPLVGAAICAVALWLAAKPRRPCPPQWGGQKPGGSTDASATGTGGAA